MRSRYVSPIFTPVKDRIGRVTSSEEMETDLVVWDLRELSLLVEKMGLRFWVDEGKKTEEEKNNSEVDVVITEVAIVDC